MVMGMGDRGWWKLCPLISSFNCGARDKNPESRGQTRVDGSGGAFKACAGFCSSGPVDVFPVDDVQDEKDQLDFGFGNCCISCRRGTIRNKKFEICDDRFNLCEDCGDKVLVKRSCSTTELPGRRLWPGRDSNPRPGSAIRCSSTGIRRKRDELFVLGFRDAGAATREWRDMGSNHNRCSPGGIRRAGKLLVSIAWAVVVFRFPRSSGLRRRLRRRRRRAGRRPRR